MVQFPDSAPSDDPDSASRSTPAESESVERQIGELVMRYLRQSPAVRVWYDGERIRAEQSTAQNERERTLTSSTTTSDANSERTEQNRQTASHSLPETQSANRDSALSTDSETAGHELNGISNVQNLTEKQAKAYLLLEQTGGDISISELAERAGYSSKGGAHSAKEKWVDTRGSDSPL